MAIISPAKSLKGDDECNLLALKLAPTVPQFQATADTLVSLLREQSVHELKKMMKVSDSIAFAVKGMLNDYEMLATDPDEIGHQAGVLYDGPAYKGLQYESLNKAQCERANLSLRFLSGLYGLLRPSDSIQPYRLEMSIKPSEFGLEGVKDLATYWSGIITNAINTTLTSTESILLNVASEEYSKAVNLNKLSRHIKVISVKFLDDGKIKSVYAKKARGLMARYVVTDPAFDGTPKRPAMIVALKQFRLEGYAYSAAASESDDSMLCFARGPVATAGKAKAKGGGGKKRKSGEEEDDESHGHAPQSRGTAKKIKNEVVVIDMTID